MRDAQGDGHVLAAVAGARGSVLDWDPVFELVTEDLAGNEVTRPEGSGREPLGCAAALAVLTTNVVQG